MADVGTFSRSQRHREAVRTLALEASLAEVARAFQSHGVRFLVLKGAAFARWLYDAPAERPYLDIDVLVSPDAFGDAQRALGEVGCSLLRTGRSASEHHEIWVHSGPMRTVVELHYTLWGVRSAPSLVWGRLSENAQLIEVAGTRVPVPSERVSTLIVALHAAQHGGRDGRHTEDLRRAVARVDKDRWLAAAALAEELGVVGQFAYGLRLDPTGCELANRLGLPMRASRLVRLHASTRPDVAVGLERLLTTHGVTARLRLLAAEAFPPPAFMRLWRPLARRGRWGLALMYLWRPIWLVLMLPRACREWIRVAAE